MDVRTLLSSTEFPPADRERWLDLASKALRGAEFEDALVSHTDDGLRVEPIYPRAADAALLPRRNPQADWNIVQRVDDRDVARANRQALDDIEQGGECRMRQRRGSARVRRHGGALRVVERDRGMHETNRRGAPALGVARAIDVAEPILPDPLEQPIRTDRFTHRRDYIDPADKLEAVPTRASRDASRRGSRARACRSSQD